MILLHLMDNRLFECLVMRGVTSFFRVDEGEMPYDWVMNDD